MPRGGKYKPMKNLNNCLLSFILFFSLLFGIQSAGLAADTPAEVNKQRLLQDLKIWVASQSGVAPDLVEIAPLDARLRVLDCSAAPVFDFPFGGREQVRARCDSPVWQLYIKVSVIAPRNTVVLLKAVAAGQVLSPADLDLRPVVRPPANSLTDRAQAVGQMTKRALGTGSVLSSMDIEEAVAVARINVAIKAGETLKATNFKIEHIARSQIPPGAVTAAAMPEGAQLTRDLPAGHVLRVEDLNSLRKILIAKQNLSIGQIVEPALFELASVSAPGPMQGYFFDSSGISNQELTRNLRTGEPLRTADLRPALLIRRGSGVLLTVVTSGGVEISIRVEALQDARMGEKIQLKNPDSGRLMNGVVTGPNTARGI